jgi:hypothetical protein
MQTGGAAAAASAPVVAVLKLMVGAEHASKLGRMSRAIELCERALAATEADVSLRGSLVLPAVLQSMVCAYAKDIMLRHLSQSSPAATLELPESVHVEVFCNTPSVNGTLLLSHSQRSLALFHARWRTGSLFALTPQEVTYFGVAVREAQLEMVRKYIHFLCGRRSRKLAAAAQRCGGRRAHERYLWRAARCAGS